MDSYVSYNKKKTRYELGKVTAARLNISGELFEQLQSAMKQSNDLIEEVSADYHLVKLKNNAVRLVDKKYKIPLHTFGTRGFGEDPLDPGSDGADLRWYGVDVYLSKDTLEEIRLGAGGVTVVLGIISVAVPEVFVASLVSSIVSYLADLGGSVCPNGVILHVYWTLALDYPASFDADCQ